MCFVGNGVCSKTEKMEWDTFCHEWIHGKWSSSIKDRCLSNLFAV